MSFIDMLRNARTSRVAVLHEFWTQYDPRQRRVHAFFEGHDDVVFYRALIEQLARPSRVCIYRCEGKPRVLEAFAQITQRVPDIKSVLFFVDKDLDDILGIPLPTDPRIFVTDVYSIENYLVTRNVFQRLYRDNIRLNGITFDETTILAQFETQLAQFYRRMLPVMAWVLMMRRRGEKPNLNNLDVGELCPVSVTCEVRHVPSRLAYLDRATGTQSPNGVFRRISPITKELGGMPPKRILRGKFEAWFFVEFWKKLVQQLRALAQESNGSVQVKISLEHNTFMAVLIPYVEVPRSLELFLKAHLSQPSVGGESISQEGSLSPVVRTWWNKLMGFK